MVEIVITILIAVPAWITALFLEQRRKKTAAADQLPYTWGYFQAASGLLSGCFAFVAVGVAARSSSAQSGVWLIWLVLALIWTPAGYFVLKRRRWAWVVHTVASLNPLWWIINTIYARNRWTEFGAEASARVGIREDTAKRFSFGSIRPWHVGQLVIAWVGLLLAAGSAAILSDSMVGSEGRSDEFAENFKFESSRFQDSSLKAATTASLAPYGLRYSGYMGFKERFALIKDNRRSSSELDAILRIVDAADSTDSVRMMEGELWRVRFADAHHRADRERGGKALQSCFTITKTSSNTSRNSTSC